MPTTAANSAGGSSVPFFRRNQVASLVPSSRDELHHLDILHSRLADSLQLLLLSPATAAGCSKAPAATGGSPKSPSADAANTAFILSLPFLVKLLDAFLACEADFESLLLLVLYRSPSLISRPPVDRAVSDLLDRVIKALDLCNAVSLSVNSVRHWNRNADTAASALQYQAPQLNRAKRALSKLLLSAGAGLGSSSSLICRRTCRLCSATRQLQAMASGLAGFTGHAAPRGGESGSTSILALALSTISYLMLFAMWAMVSAFPCGRPVQAPPAPAASTRQMPWAAALAELQESIVEQLRRERRKELGVVPSAGMLAEIVALERSGREAMEAVSNGGETKVAAEELAEACRAMEDGLGPFETKVREVFHRLVRCREGLLRCFSEGSRSSPSPTPPL
ncbi:hypothetical protein AXF42_Ash006325 [Apostasia shenzhenica]|uniref:Uncharacterized protein n=1 Tax=Apostasia shenzhenica TaxID=1088818 RepID=A0A2I0AYS0_9ASPA|nr:hypothetical protein AXF42_Ash006325 [Apostasia shenzhenica]